MHPRAAALALAFTLPLLAACPDDAPPAGPAPDAVIDATAPGDVDAAADSAPGPCTTHWSCGPEANCLDGECVPAPTCAGPGDWSTCMAWFDTHSPGLGLYGACLDDVCKVVCVTDEDCLAAELCTDFGVCRPFTGELGAAPVGGAAGTLRAGVGEAPLRFPIGLSMGGFASRAATDDGRYVEALRASHGQMHGLDARALALDDGTRQVLIVRLPVIFITAEIHEAVARYLQAATGADWRDHLILSASHTHSGPTRHWHLPDFSLVPLGSFGTDEFSPIAERWLVDSIAEAALAALDDLAPARLGWTVLEAYDMDDAIARDRWTASPPFDDNRALLVRVDDADGVPRAILFSLGVHGTHASSDYLHDDVLGGMERAWEAWAGDRWGRTVPALYLSQNNGTMAPRSGDAGHRSAHVFEKVGHLLVTRAAPALEAIETRADVIVDARTHRFHLTHERLGYGPDEFGDGSGRGLYSAYLSGGLGCLATADDDDYATYTDPDDVRCLGLDTLAWRRTATLFTRSQITALTLGDLTAVTMPGEVSMEVGWQVQRALRDELGLDVFTTWVLGYAQDHLGYILPTNLRGELPPFPGISTPMPPDDYPDFAFSYLQGGYETSIHPWGWRTGDFLVDRAVEAVRALRDPGFGATLPFVYPSEMTPPDVAPFPLDVDDPAAVGTLLAPLPAQVARLDVLELAWIGGDPGVEMPQAPRVALEREGEGGAFAPVLRPSRRVYDNRDAVMLTRLRRGDGAWEWVVRWEELESFPLGRYRFRVTGRAHHGDGEGTPYEIITEPFELTPAPIDVTELSVSPTAAAGRLAYPAGPELRYEGVPDDRGRVTGSFRMRHPEVPTGVPHPPVVGADLAAEGVSLTLVSDDGAEVAVEAVEVTTAYEAIGGRQVPVTRFTATLPSAPPGVWTLRVEVLDDHGNRGEASAPLTDAR